ncbi:hypothetical protein O6H91_16G071700 [Diphasiastrum complanatum]|uniref:Uncharacterized protein n=3 Tax=Diphasiastrum complanatum TaxID=34168 RepID=A0ACC2BDD5_DIPCM|nr:hypothetical protein O6H91_16G071700 [Diphasiastrum complanatum]KAJ7527801.1 hypothetical protein O6H91_16G071700 [Diphasiastrum complanatum]KAJ7527803.1 hypothetical protein O6H91_16G071700 [Diphasiastrum complanatum]
MASTKWQEVLKKFLNLKSRGDEFGADEEENSPYNEEDSSELLPHKAPQSYRMLLRGQSEALFTELVDVQDLRIFVGTWNVAGKSPPTDLEMTEWLSTKDQVDLYIIGFQEIVPLNAGNVLGAEDEGPAGKWEALIRKTLNNSSPAYKNNERAAQYMETEHLSNPQGVLEEEVEKKALPAELALCTSEKKQQRCLLKQSGLSQQKAIRKAKSATEEIFLTWWPDTVAQRQKNQSQELEGTCDESKFSGSNIDFQEDQSNIKLKTAYVRIVSKQMVGIFLTVWIRKEIRIHVQNPKVSCIGCGFMGYYGNKGSIAVSMSLHQTSFCFVCSHLTSGDKEGDELRRNADVTEILRKTHFHRSSKMDGEDLPESILAHDRIIWLGDLNYRLSLSDMETRNLVAKEDWRALLEKDQLKIEQCAGRVFQGWEEGPILFPPTYKYVINSGHYSGEFQNSGEKQRTPAWCDRILWFGKGLKQIFYCRGEYTFSDHRPVKAIFSADVDILNPRKLKRVSTIWKISSAGTDRGECSPINLEFLNEHLEKRFYNVHFLRALHKYDHKLYDIDKGNEAIEDLYSLLYGKK